MKFASYVDAKQHVGFGLVRFDADGPVGIVNLEDQYPTLRDLLADPAGITLAQSRASAPTNVSFDGLTLLPVIPNPGKIICVGLNYGAHVEETGRPWPTHPTIFLRFADTQVGANEALLCPKVSDWFNFEGELAVVIGQSSRYVPKDDALSRVAGYSCYNDASVRDWQRHSQQFGPGKNFPRTGAFGPWLVTPDEMPDFAECSLETRLNGKVMQTAKLDDLIFDVPTLIAYCSSFTQLEPGDVIITGTPSGVGLLRDPRVWMKQGDTVEVEITGIGTLSNPIAQEPADTSI